MKAKSKAKSAAKISLARLSKEELLRRATTKCEHHHTLLDHPQCNTVPEPHIGYYDIETSNLDADFGIILTWAILDGSNGEILHDQITKSDIAKADKDVTGHEDRRLVGTLVANLQRFDILVGYYSKRFDGPYIRTRAVAMGIYFPPFGNPKHVDVYDIMRHRFKLSSNRLENANRSLLGTSDKTRVSGRVWRAGARANPTALAEILDHNIKDVMDLEKLYSTIKEFSRRNEVSL